MTPRDETNDTQSYARRVHEEEEDNDDSRMLAGKEGRYTTVQQPVGELWKRIDG